MVFFMVSGMRIFLLISSLLRDNEYKVTSSVGENQGITFVAWYIIP